MTSLESTQAEVSRLMNQILDHFKPGRKITVLVRTPGEPAQDFMMSNDDLAEATKMIQRRMEAAP
jgi:hypothetical protein